MTISRKSTIAASLFLCMALVMQSGGWFFMAKSLLGFRQFHEHFIANDQPSVALVFSESHYDRISIGDDEILHQGDFYDIQKISRSNGQVHVQAVKDHFEAGVLAFCKSLGAESKGHQKHVDVIRFFKFVMPAFGDIHFFEQETILYADNFLIGYSSFNPAAATPPPEA
ncbi:MAG: hypothetical protein ACKOKB_08825 [Bacteroidota bacterium]